MRNNEGVYRKMNAVIYYSNADESRRVAVYLAGKLGYELLDIELIREYRYDNLLLAFPVYCQNIPQKVTAFLARLNVNNLAVVATYGKVNHGNVLYEIQRLYKHNIIAAAYVPAKHAYIDGERFEQFDKLDVIVSKFDNPSRINVPKSYKNPFANIFKGLRSRLGVKIVKDCGKCDNCNICGANCPQKASNYGKTNCKCIRCARCVTHCPQQALKIVKSKIMAKYLAKTSQNELVVYVK